MYIAHQPQSSYNTTAQQHLPGADQKEKIGLCMSCSGIHQAYLQSEELGWRCHNVFKDMVEHNINN